MLHRFIVALSVVLLPAVGSAHDGAHAAGLSGVAHQLTHLDHVAAIVAALAMPIVLIAAWWLLRSSVAPSRAR